MDDASDCQQRVLVDSGIVEKSLEDCRQAVENELGVMFVSRCLNINVGKVVFRWMLVTLFQQVFRRS